MAMADRLDFGMLATGMMVGINEVANGLECGCVCAACRAPLIARQGAIRRWHFSHAPGFVACETGAETALHRMAKQIIAQWDDVTLPPLEVRVSQRSVTGQTIARDVTIPGTRFVAEKGVIEARCNGFVPDVLLHGPKGELLAIEVCVTHKVSRAKQQRVAEHALPMIQFSIDLADDSSAEAAELEQRLRESTPEWIFHPKEAELRLQLEAEVEAALHQLQDEQKARQEELQPMLSDGTTDLFTEVDRRRGDSSPLRAQTGPDQFEVLGCQVVVNVATTAGVWACTASLPLQEQILHQITADAGDHGLRVTAPIHTTSHGIVIVAGAAVRSWASGLARRLCKAFPDNVTPEELES